LLREPGKHPCTETHIHTVRVKTVTGTARINSPVHGTREGSEPAPLSRSLSFGDAKSHAAAALPRPSRYAGQERLLTPHLAWELTVATVSRCRRPLRRGAACRWRGAACRWSIVAFERGFGWTLTRRGDVRVLGQAGRALVPLDSTERRWSLHWGVGVC